MNAVAPRTGPLAGVRVVEFAGIGPGPMCAMLLSDLGADVLRLERPGGTGRPNPILTRGRGTMQVDMKSAAGIAICLAAADSADIVIEGYRPGVMERLGFGPDVLTARNPRLIYGRMTGWGQSGPLAQTAGHDINYIALSGALAGIGGPGGGPSVPPLNLVGDFGGGSLYLALGLVAALHERDRSGIGQVVDCAIVDGVASMMAMLAGLAATGSLSLDRDRSMLGGAAPFYRCYSCADGLEIAIGAIEPPFYRELLSLIGARPGLADEQDDIERWPQATEELAAIFRSKPRAAWCALLESSDACFAPVLSLDDAPAHPHLHARETYQQRDGIDHPAPAPRFSRTPGAIAPTTEGQEMLDLWRR